MIVAQYVKMGSKLYVEGSLKTRSWEQDGVKRYATEIIANEMQMLDVKNERGDTVTNHDEPAEEEERIPF